MQVVNNTAADTLNAESAARVTAVSGALQRRVSWDRVLRELSMVLPSDVWLTTLTAKAPQSAILTVPAAPPAPGATPTGLVIGGYTYSQDAVARLLSRLAGRPRPDERPAPVERGHAARELERGRVHDPR